MHVHTYSRVVGSRTPDPRRCYHSPRVRMHSIFVGGYSGIAGDLVAYVTFCEGAGDDLKKRDTPPPIPGGLTGSHIHVHVYVCVRAVIFVLYVHAE